MTIVAPLSDPVAAYYAAATGPMMGASTPAPMPAYGAVGNGDLPTVYYPVPSVAYEMGAQPGLVDAIDQVLADLVPEDAAVTATSTLGLGFPGFDTLAESAPAPTPAKGRISGAEIWAGVRNPRAIHLTQVVSRFNRRPAAGRLDCGPVSVVMALRLLGLKAPGASAPASAQIDRVRVLATGARGRNGATTDSELERALTASGASTTEIASIEEVEQAVKTGKPVILNGNPRHPGAYGLRVSPKKLVPYDGPHWITVSGFDTASGRFIINDPLSTGGALKVTRAELAAYLGSSLGIVVDRA